MKIKRQEEVMKRGTFNQELIVGLNKIRNTRPETRTWLRQCIEIEKTRRSR